MDVWLAAAERQRTHGDLVNLSAGQPSAGAPGGRPRRGEGALDNTVLGYTVALGIPELRTAIADSYQLRHGLAVDPGEVVITTGSSGGFLLAFLACFDVGDRVAIASPGYPCYRNILSALGCEVVEMPCGPDTRFQPTAQMLAELDPPLKGVIVASPANPTGTVIPPDELAAIASWCDASGVRLISDEVYHGLVYEGSPDTSCAWQTSREAVVVNSFSKYFAMTGWRLGWLLVPQELQRAVDCLTGNFTICPPTLAQMAAVAAFTPESIAEADALLHHYATNRRLLLDGLRDDRNRPAGADRRRVLRVRRRLAPDRRLAVVLLEAAGRHRCRHRAGYRFRHHTRRLVSCGCRSRDRRATSRRRCGGSAPGSNSCRTGVVVSNACSKNVMPCSSRGSRSWSRSSRRRRPSRPVPRWRMDELRRTDEAASGVPKARQGRGVASEVALARRDSPRARRPAPGVREGLGVRDAAHPGGAGVRGSVGVAGDADRARIGLPGRRGPAQAGYRNVCRRHQAGRQG